ncbi:MAG: hypothetical protein JNM00_03145 [Flavobacteriales bacterium]|nr:hypothetical protein [Flavobacteriales bacterium]
MMKQKKTFRLVAVVVAAMALVTCKPDIEGELGTHPERLGALNGEWKISAFSQLDLNNPVQEERDLSEFFIVEGETPLTIQFNSSDLSYTVVPGPGKNYFGNGGTWGFDNADYPSYLFLYGDDTLRFNLGSIVKPTDSNMVLALPRNCDDGAGNVLETVIYNFEFERAN